MRQEMQKDLDLLQRVEQAFAAMPKTLKMKHDSALAFMLLGAKGSFGLAREQKLRHILNRINKICAGG